jgi:hypothetical protein
MEQLEHNLFLFSPSEAKTKLLQVHAHALV